MSEVRETEYNGSPLIGVYRDSDDKFGFKFGVKKARMILERIDDIKAFVEKYTKTPAQVA
ncbi:MAG: hypothetical protein A3G34_12750 [Candidatus Lindowbacteria bacterium RIFCSPLOWO2_12_FULL_62_27]|nr:MAG: hypothetical protein A3I06_15315 [Candidatus Lindowbacteria bacterium RIFCSPLOWO2_02_FULL_62_12]OGH62463.1 MAG: hypothetical protein A3G34_12750 [Candidatus Lindowbacteria bacterium RIFCSPLOWO2_12_FULL_62_27]